jgi:hypothetical protein
LIGTLSAGISKAAGAEKNVRLVKSSQRTIIETFNHRGRIELKESSS